MKLQNVSNILLKGSSKGYKAGISQNAKQSIRSGLKEVIQSTRYNHPIEWFAQMLNAKLRGWFTYYGAFTKRATMKVLSYANFLLSKWIMNVYKLSKAKAYEKLYAIQVDTPELFYHWKIGVKY